VKELKLVQYSKILRGERCEENPQDKTESERGRKVRGVKEVK
jgi:hypothetical protein